MIALAAGVVVGLYLLIAPPTLPHERERTSAAPPVPTPARGAARPAGVSTSPDPAPAPAPATVPPPAAAGTPPTSPQMARRHTIQPGDTLLAIAERYDTTVTAIRAANPGLSETALQVGAEIVIPPSP